jgi:hypothetical protein
MKFLLIVQFCFISDYYFRFAGVCTHCSICCATMSQTSGRHLRTQALRQGSNTHWHDIAEERCYIISVQAGVVRGLELDWDGWEHNEARELVHLCQLNHLLN